MKAHQEIDALTTMNIPAAKILWCSLRRVAVLVMMPVPIIITNIGPWFGGSVVAR